MNWDNNDIQEQGFDILRVNVKVPYVIEYDEMHFLFVVSRFKGRHYFWLYFLEDGFLSGGRQFHANLILSPTTDRVKVKESSPNNVIYPITIPANEIVSKAGGFLYFVGDKGLLQNYSKDNMFQISIFLKELERKLFETSQKVLTELLNVQEAESKFCDEEIQKEEHAIIKMEAVSVEFNGGQEELITEKTETQNESFPDVNEVQDITIQLKETDLSNESSAPGQSALTYCARCVTIACQHCNFIVYTFEGTAKVTVTPELGKTASVSVQTDIRIPEEKEVSEDVQNSDHFLDSSVAKVEVEIEEDSFQNYLQSLLKRSHPYYLGIQSLPTDNSANGPL